MTTNKNKKYLCALTVLLAVVSSRQPSHAQLNIEEPPIAYSETGDDNRVTDLIKSLKNGETSLKYDLEFGYLKSVLEALDIPVSSQTLVFSKTSMQIAYISPRTPRAIYFSDDTYVGWVQGSSLMEISTNDPRLGAAFYIVRMSPRRPHIQRQFYNCLACHASTLTQGVPGHTVRSVMSHPDGTMDVQRKSYVTDHSSPFTERWGGWYVTGQHGDLKHMGNAFLRGGKLVAHVADNPVDLSREFYTEDWLAPHSDIIALMVLEHQTQMQNAFTVANFTVRRALYDANQTQNTQQERANGGNETTNDDVKQELNFIIEQAAKNVVGYMLFVNEAPLTSEIQSSTTFVKDFIARGPTDAAGRTLREFNLRERMFEYPCSYLIYSPAFDALEPRLRQAIYRRLWNALTETTEPGEYAHLSSSTRRTLVDILRSTKPGLPNYWNGVAH